MMRFSKVIIFGLAILKVDEEGSDAAAATAFGFGVAGFGPPFPPRKEIVRVEHPFLFAIQDARTGTCLFLGKIEDPR